MRCTIGERKFAVGIEVFLRVGQARSRRSEHAVIFLARRRLRLELSNPHEIVEFLPGHHSRSFFEPTMKILGRSFSFWTNDPFRDAFRFQSSGVMNVELTLRPNLSSTFCEAV